MMVCFPPNKSKGRRTTVFHLQGHQGNLLDIHRSYEGANLGFFYRFCTFSFNRNDLTNLQACPSSNGGM